MKARLITHLKMKVYLIRSKASSFLNEMGHLRIRATRNTWYPIKKEVMLLTLHRIQTKCFKEFKHQKFIKTIQIKSLSLLHFSKLIIQGIKRKKKRLRVKSSESLRNNPNLMEDKIQKIKSWVQIMFKEKSSTIKKWAKNSELSQMSMKETQVR